MPGPTLSIWLLPNFKERIPKWKTKKRQDRLEEEYYDPFEIILIGTLNWLELLYPNLHNKLNELFCAAAVGFRNFPLCSSAQDMRSISRSVMRTVLPLKYFFLISEASSFCANNQFKHLNTQFMQPYPLLYMVFWKEINNNNISLKSS